MRRAVGVAGTLWVGLALAGCQAPQEKAAEVTAPSVAPDVEQRLARFAPTELTVDLSGFDEQGREVLRQLVAAGHLMDEIFLRQVWEGNPNLRSALAAAGVTGAARTYFDVNFGPWDRLNGFEPFIGDRPHPDGAGYYPEDMTKDEFDSWIAAHPDQAEAMRSLTTVIRRGEEGLEAIPYSEAYAKWLEPAAEHLLKAALATDNVSLRRYLELRAKAFLDDDYYASDVAWMDLDSPIEVTIGPYETYEDTLFGYKSAFEAYVTISLPEESAALDRYKSELPALEQNLPIPDEHKNPNRGTESPIRVVDLLFSAGDAKAGIQTVAFNLPNDERVREAKGSKKVMLHNTMRAKYEKILVPIAERVLAADQIPLVSFEAFFDVALHHELAHGLGPGKLVLDGRATEVRLELKDLYSTLEEAKADVLGVYDILHLIDAGVMPAELRKTLEATYVAGLFRGARFGVHEAHGQGIVSQFNFLTEKGAVAVDEDGRFRTVPEKFAEGIHDLCNELLMIQATGDYARAQSFLATYGVATPAILGAIDRLEDVPVDIRPIFPQAEELEAP